MESLKDKNTTMEEEENEYELKEYHPIEDLHDLGINFKKKVMIFKNFNSFQ